MSVQLVVYPQWFDGVMNPIVSPSSSAELLVNPTNFTGANSTNAYSVNANVLSQTAIDDLFPFTAGSWIGYNNAAGGMTTGGIGGIIFAVGSCGVFQQMSGLVVGAVYDVKITWSTAVTPQNINVRIYNGTQIVLTVLATPDSNNEDTIQFIAPSVNNTSFNLDYDNDVLSTVILETSVKTSSGLANINNGSVICDLYEDEDIPLTLSVDNFKNAAESVQSYSKAFNLPATKRNNRIFDNIFEITRNIDLNSIYFNPLKRTKAVLKQDGIVLFEGFMRMLDISEKEGEISYNVNLYAEVTALADTLKESTFQDLGFTELNHDYTRDQIRNSWNTSGAGVNYSNPNTSGFRTDYKTLKYPFVDWNHQMVVSNGTNGTAGNPELTKLEQAFRPFIQIKYLIDRIFQNSPFTYTSDFFNTSVFDNLYMDFNWGAEEDGASDDRNDTLYQETSGLVNQWLSHSWQNVNLQTTISGNNALWNTNKFVSDVNNLEVSGSYRIQLHNVSASPKGCWLKFQKFNANNVILETFEEDHPSIASGGAASISSSFSTILNSGEYLALRVYQDSTSSSVVKVSLTTTSYLNITYNNNSSQVDTLLNSARADVNQWEFLKGIMTMFNLVTLPDSSNINNIIIETYENIFIKTSNNNSVSLADRGITHNWTEKVDYTTMKIAPLADLSAKTIFKFVEEDEDYAFNVYKRDVQEHLYGSKVFDAVFSYDLTILSGQDEVVAEPFAATVIKPLMSQYLDFVVPSLYAMNDDGETAGFANAPRIMYNSGITTLQNTDYYVPAQNGIGSTTYNNYLEFSHLSDSPTAAHDLDFNFGVCQLIPPWNPVTNNLFQLYWMPYYSELYNPNTRVVTVKIDLSAGDINMFKFNDQIMLKNRAYRVNQINYKPNDFATVELILLNYV
tara:strand:- start:101 stop:2809 length:2709 start_codon:yes stop_codon:yes gene_type:complete